MVGGAFEDLGEQKQGNLQKRPQIHTQNLNAYARNKNAEGSTRQFGKSQFAARLVSFRCYSTINNEVLIWENNGKNKRVEHQKYPLRGSGGCTERERHGSGDGDTALLKVGGAGVKEGGARESERKRVYAGFLSLYFIRQNGLILQSISMD